MQAEQEGMMLVRAELCERLASLRRMSERRPAGSLAEAVAGIRTLAAAYGLIPVVRLAEAMERAAREAPARGGCPAGLFLDRMQDAIGCTRLDESAGQAMIASVSVRLGA